MSNEFAVKGVASGVESAGGEFSTTRTMGRNGRKCVTFEHTRTVFPRGEASAESSSAKEVAENSEVAREAAEGGFEPVISDQQDSPSGRKLRVEEVPVGDTKMAEPAQENVSSEGSETAGRGVGRPAALDDFKKGQIAGDLALGLSVRQAAAHLGVSHSTVLAAIKRDAEFAEKLETARQQSQLHPLLVIVQESRKNWRAATWLLKYLGNQGPVVEPSVEERAEGTAHWFSSLVKALDKKTA